MSKKKKRKQHRKKEVTLSPVETMAPEKAEETEVEEELELDDPDESEELDQDESVEDESPEDVSEEVASEEQDDSDEPEENEDPEEDENLKNEDLDDDESGEEEFLDVPDESKEEDDSNSDSDNFSDDAILVELSANVPRVQKTTAEKRRYTRSDDIMKDFTDSYEEFMSTFDEKKAKLSDIREDESDDEETTGRVRRRSSRASRRHVGETPEEREARFEIRRNKQRRRRRIIALCVVIAALAAIGVTVAGYFSSAYNSDKDFQNFADQQFHKMKVLPRTSDRLVTYEYDDGISYAYRYDPSDNEELAVFRDQQVADLKKKFNKKIAKEMEKEGSGSGSLFGRDTHHAMLFDSAVYETGNGALSMAIYGVEYDEESGKMQPIGSSIQTYLLDPETLRVLNPMQVLTPDYKEKAAAISEEYIQDNYKEEQIKDDAENYLKEDDANYNRIVISKGNMSIYFDEGTVVDESEGVVVVPMKKSRLGTSLRGQMIERYIDPDKPMVAITYDDGPGTKSEKRIIKCLKKHGAVATFFYLGNRVGYSSNNVKNAYKIGCEIGNHSWDHSDLTGLSAAGVKSQLSRTNKAIHKLIGVTPELYRPPYGSFNQSVLDAANMPAILWTVDTLDWSSRDPKAVFNIVKKTKKLDGKIILMHSIYDSTAKATEKIVPYLMNRGYQIVTVSELIKYKSGASPKKNKVYMSGNK